MDHMIVYGHMIRTCTLVEPTSSREVSFRADGGHIGCRVNVLFVLPWTGFEFSASLSNTEKKTTDFTLILIHTITYHKRIEFVLSPEGIPVSRAASGGVSWTHKSVFFLKSRSRRPENPFM